MSVAGTPVESMITHGFSSRQQASTSIKLLHRPSPSSKAFFPALFRNRFQVINFWRPILHPAVDWPLALCDYRSFNVDEDLMEGTAILNSCPVQYFRVKYNPNYRWIYKSAVEPEDFVLFKTLVRIMMVRCFHQYISASTVVLL